MIIGMTLSRDHLDAPLAEHFGKAKWLLVMEYPDRWEFVRNQGLDGRSVAAAFAARGCTDVIVRHLGPGAYSHVTSAGMKVWQGEGDKNVLALVDALRGGRLRLLQASDVEQGHGHGGPHGGGH
jgi:predicted Fe-Mo cluster-binding NifX family protein